MNISKRTYLSQWIQEEITDDDLKGFVSEEDFNDFRDLREFLDMVKLKELDNENSYETIKQKKKSRKSVKKTLPIKTARPWWKYTGVAAGFALVFGLFQIFYFSNIVSTQFGDTMAFTLKDKSEVILNSKSTVSFPNLFQINRSLKLEGEAYFKVYKGSTFTVKTETGTVEVLGTKFNVISYDDYFEVQCYEGSVRVTTNNQSHVLTPGEHFRTYDKHTENWAELNRSEPLWLQSESSFKNLPLKYVITSFERQYGTKVVCPEKFEKIKFTGSFPNQNKEVALKSICTPLNLTYKIDGRNILISE